MRNQDDNATFEAEQEILAILSRMQPVDAKDTVSDTPVPEETETPADPFAAPDAPTAEPVSGEMPLIFGEDEEPQEEKRERRVRVEKAAKRAAKENAKMLVTEDDTPAAPVEAVSPFARIGTALCNLIPKKGDETSEIVRKCVFLLSLAVFICSLCFLLYYMVLEPGEVTKENEYYVSLYNDTEGNKDTVTNEETKSIKPSFRQLYEINKDVAGWLSYNSADSDRFMKINLPVVWCGDNDTYLTRGFDGKYSRSGTLFFEQSNTFKEGISNKVTIIYGHNMASGAMFAPLNKIIGNVYRARAASVMTMDTLYESNQYKVFAVIVSDESADPAHRFGYLRTAFADENDFMTYVNELRARSLFDYPVDVQPSDELLILSTCTNKSQVKVDNGRFAVIARRVREGENVTTDTAKIVKNDDAIMPYAWYTAQGLTPHAFYTQSDYELPTADTTGNNTTTGSTTDTTTDVTTDTTTDGTTDATTNGTTTVTTTNTNTTVTEGEVTTTTNEQVTTTVTDTGTTTTTLAETP